MTRPVPHRRIDLYRQLLAPCRLDVHPQMHARPSTFCQRKIGVSSCTRCVLVDALLRVDFPAYDDGYMLAEELRGEGDG